MTRLGDAAAWLAERERLGAPVLLWIAVGLPPLVFLADLTIAYALAPPACRDGGATELLLGSALALALVAASGVLAWRIARGLAPDAEPGRAFLARGAVVLAAATFAVLLALALPRALYGCP